MATIDLGKIKMVFRGTYAGGTAYVPDDLVVYTDGSVTSTYICTTATTGNAPSSGGTAHGSWAFVAKGQASSPTTTRGDLIVRGASADERLAIGTAGQALKVNGAANGFEFGTAAGIVGFKHIRNTSTTTINSTSFTTVFSGSYTPVNGSANKVYVMVSGQYQQDDNNGATASIKIACSGQHSNDISQSAQTVGYDDSYNTFNSLSMFLEDTSISNNTAVTYSFQASTSNASSDFRPKTSLSLTVIEVSSGVNQS